jgi:selenocysteine-specific elongation factor
MEARSYILATAGHVDHGKSALVLALTGTDPDRLPEEKARGITIDLGFAALQLNTPAGVLNVGIVDVPGHEDFVKNMVAGVGSIDVALLVVAADDGWMPQTEEHLQILTYLGVSRGVVALTKIDLAAGREDLVIAAVRERLAGTPLAAEPIVPTSAPSGRGISELKAALMAVLGGTTPQRDIGKPRLPIDRVFSLKGIGTVVTGTLGGGLLRRGQQVVVQPIGATARVRSIQTHKREVEVGVPGSRVALNLPDLHVSRGRGSRSSGTIARGDVVTIAACGSPTRCVDIAIERSPRSIVGLRSGAIVQVHYGTVAIPARVRLAEVSQLPAGQRSVARLALQAPLLALVGDRLVIRDWPEQHTLAGGVVIDINAPTDSLPPRQWLDRAADARSFVESQLRRDAVGKIDEIGAMTRFSRGEIDEAVKALTVSQSLVVSGGAMVADAASWAALRNCVADAVDAHHRVHPELGGLPLTELTPTVSETLPRHVAGMTPMVVDALLAAMCGDGEFTRTQTVLRRAAHRVSLPPRLEPAARQLRRGLDERPFDPPSRKELCGGINGGGGDVASQALRFMIANGEAVEIGPEVVLSAAAYQRAVAMIREHLCSKGPARVSDLKTLLGSSRRVMVPLLEKLDREHVTRREGDLRFAR